MKKALEGYLGGMENPAWRMEQEIDFSIRSGIPIYKIFREELHVAKKSLVPIKNIPILRGWDYGLTPACAIAQLTPRPRLNVFPCLYTPPTGSIGIKRFTEQVIEYCSITFPGYKFIDWGDPAGNAQSQTDERTCFDIQREFKDPFGNRLVDVQAGEISWTGRHRAMEDVLKRLEDDGIPFLQIDPSERFLIDAFKGGYRKRKVAQTKELYVDEPEKNEFSHLMNALEYLVSRIKYGRPLKKAKVETDSTEIAESYQT